MADIKGTNIASAITPFTDEDKYPTHHAKYGKGGYKSVADINERNLIPQERLEDGCKVYVRSEDKEYRYKTASRTWEEVKFGSDITVDEELDKTSTNPVQNQAVANALSAIAAVKTVTMTDYMAMKESDTLENVFYAIYRNGELDRMYFQKTLFARKAKDGEEPTVTSAFPLIFPIIFG